MEAKKISHSFDRQIQGNACIVVPASNQSLIVDCNLCGLRFTQKAYCNSEARNFLLCCLLL